MTKDKAKQLEKQRKSLFLKLSKLSNCLPGQLTSAYLVCNRGRCKCTRGEPHGPAWRLTWKENKKTKIFYVRLQEVQLVKKGTLQHKKAKKLLKKIAFLNLEILKVQRD